MMGIESRFSAFMWFAPTLAICELEAEEIIRGYSQIFDEAGNSAWGYVLTQRGTHSGLFGVQKWYASTEKEK